MSAEVVSHRERCRQQLIELLGRRRSLDVVQAALLVAAEDYPDLDVDAQRSRVARIGEQAARLVDGLENPFARLDRVRELLFEEHGLRGDTNGHDDPENSYLNRVLDRRRGIPLTLSILFIEIAGAAGFEAVGVALPGHFVTRVDRGGRSILVDPFHGGRVITEDDCRQLVIRSTGRAELFRRDVLLGTSPEATFVRLLQNLKRIFLSREDYDRTLGIVERLLLLAPDDPGEIRDRGILMSHLGRPGAAIADLEAYLALVPEAPDANALRGRLAWLRRKMAKSN